MKKYKILLGFAVQKLKRLRSEIKILTPVFLVSILLIECWFNKIPASSQIIYDLGIIYLRFCYSLLSAFLVYYLVVFAPKDKKKAKSFLLVHNSIAYLRRNVTDLIRITYSLRIEEFENFKVEDFNKKGLLINPQSPILVTSVGINNLFLSHFKYFNMLHALMTNRIKTLFPFYDIIDDEVFKELTELYDSIDNFFNFNEAKYANTDITFLSDFFYEVNQKTLKLSKITREKYHSYQKLYHHLACQHNLEEMKRQN